MKTNPPPPGRYRGPLFRSQQALSAFLAVVIAVQPSTALAATFYVNANSTATGTPDGSQEAPFRRFAEAYSRARAGDIIRIRGGDYTDREARTYGLGQPDSRGITVQLWGAAPATIGASVLPPNGTPGDSDGDGMPDAWERANDLNPRDPRDAAHDNDKDGLTNLQEYERRSNPRQSNLVGSLPGQFTVDSSGSASYTIPITIPPGTAGMQPSVAVNLKSRGGNGVLGVGGSISGVSAITRSGRTIEQDGKTGGVEFDGNDRFSLDGQRLVLVSGTYGGDGAEYRTEIESFSKIVSLGNSGSGPASFRVWTKSGQILDFGSTDGSRIKVAGAEHVMVWALKKVSDTRENYIQYNYDFDSSDRSRGEYHLRNIEYTGNTATGLRPYARINFGYEDRADVSYGRVGPYPVTLSKRLKQVSTEVDGATVLTYNFTYEYGRATARSRLTSVQLCDSKNVCLPATQIEDWTDSDSNPSFDVKGPFRPGSGYFIAAGNYSYLSGDLDGDGRTDLIHLDSNDHFNIWKSVGDGTFQVSGRNHSGVQANLNHFVSGDYNGDGRADFFHVVSKFAAEMWSGTPGGDISIAAATVGGVSRFEFDINDPLRYYALDFNGDGRTDLFHVDSNGKARLFRSKGGNDFDLTEILDPPYRLTENDDNYFPCDVNGDGLTDLIHFNPASSAYTGDEYWVWLSLGTGRFDIKRYRVPANWLDKNKSEFLSGDFNGDGRTDFLHYYGPSQCEIWFGAQPSETGIFHRVILHPGNLNTGISGYNFEGRNGANFRFFVADYNGDGKSDIIHVFSRTEIVFWRSLGTGGRFAAEKVVLKGPSAYDFKGDSEFSYQVGDFNGDGQSDFVHFYDNTKAYVWQRDDKLPDLFKKIEDGYDNRVEISYAPLTDNGVYSKGNSARYPVQDMQGPLYVVANTRQSDGIGGMHQVDRKYSGARAHLTGRGFLGFETVEATDTRTEISSVTRYRQDFPFAGQPVSSRSTLKSGRVIADSDSTWEARALGGTPSRQFVFNSRSVSRSFELTGDTSPITTTTTTSVFDDFGNPTRMIVDSGDGYKKTTVSDYRNDTRNWILGRLLSSSVTADAPGVPSQTRVSAFEYTAAGLLRWEEIEPNRLEFTLRTTYAHDSYGNRISANVTGRDIVSRASTTEYDSRGRFPRIARNALGHSAMVEHNPRFGYVEKATDANGLVTTAVHDGFGRALAEYRPDGTRTFFAYMRPDSDSPDHCKYMVRAFVTGEQPETVYHDSLGRVLRERRIGFKGPSENNTFEDTEYDRLGRVKFKSRPYFEGRQRHLTEYSYDLLNRVTREVLPDQSTTIFDYAGLRVTISNPEGQRRTEIKNSQGQVAEVLDHYGKSLRHRFDAFGNLLESIDSAGNKTLVTYDIRGRKLTLQEPGLPAWSYSHNTLGELVRQEDGKRQVVTLEYDILGRLVERNEPEGKTRWVYDTGHKAIGKLAVLEGVGGYREGHFFDDVGRPTRSAVTINGQTFETGFAYDYASRVEKLVYPTGFTIQNVFNTNGFVSKVQEFGGKGTIFWQANDINPSGQIVQETFGNHHVTTRDFDPRRGWVRSIETGNRSIQNFAYNYNRLGNLTNRADGLQGLTEAFQYDDLNRLTSATIAGRTPVQFSYDEVGNLRSKTSVGTYQYGGTGKSPYAVASVDGLPDGSFVYDDNGNQVSGASRSVVYSSFNKPLEIRRSGNISKFSYGPSHERLTHTDTIGEDSSTTVYAFDHYEEVHRPTDKEQRHYVSVGGRLVAILTLAIPAIGTPTERTRYIHTDHLGSVESLTDDKSQLAERFAYDPHGKRLGPSWSPVPSGSLSSSETERAFGSHIQLDSLDLIHMGGRAFDPIVGRFLTPDITVQAPANQQAHNRYSYVINNPLSLTDPSGYFFDNIEHFGRTYGRQVGALAAAAVITYFTAGTGAAFAGALVAGGTSAAIASRGDFRSIAIGVGTAALFYGVGSAYTPPEGAEAWTLTGSGTLDYVSKTVAHGIVGGVSSSLQGGTFQSGFASSAFAEAIAGDIDNLQSENNPALAFIGRVTAASIAGGIGAELGGGKFKNGAITGAFSRLFNAEAHDEESSYGLVEFAGDAVFGVSIAFDIFTGPSPDVSFLGAAARTAIKGGAKTIAKKAISLPSYRKVKIDMKEVLSGHTATGLRALQSGKKDLFEKHLTPRQIEKAIRYAYKHGTRISTQGDRVLVRGPFGARQIEMYVNVVSKRVETAYPK